MSTQTTHLWFTEPADSFVASCPLGNGALGAMVFGGTGRERIVLNESTMWSGGVQTADRPDAARVLADIRLLLLAGQNPEAEDLVNRAFVCQGAGSGSGRGKDLPFGCYQTLGELTLHMPEGGPAWDYRRQLDLEEAVARVEYTVDGIRQVREAFVSAPDQVLVVRLESDAAEGVTVTCRLGRSERATVAADGDDVVLHGALADGVGGEGIRFAARLHVVAADGRISASADGATVTAARSVVLLLAAATSYGGSDPAAVARARVVAAAGRDYASLRRRHAMDHRRYYDRLALSLPATVNSAQSTPDRLAGFAAGASDPALAALYFNFGRYLLVSSSRPDSPLPANLQGIWAEETQTPWNGDFHLDINVQMNYWPAGPTGLIDCQLPLVRLIEGLVAPGRRTAQAYYGARGWVAHVITNPWGFTAPGEHAGWGSTCSGSAWLCAHLWEHYRYTQDLGFLARIYPVLRESAEFYLDMLVTEPLHGWLVTAPSNSPENRFRLADGREAHTCMGPTVDMQLLRELFANTRHAACLLGRDPELQEELAGARSRLAPLQVGAAGRLQEWLEDYAEPEPHHRHTSHLYGLFPGAEITAATPAAFAAARASLDARGDESTGWSLAWKVALWARLGDGRRAHHLLKQLLRPQQAMGFDYQGGGGTYPNLFCAHPPFQIDGNLGGCAAIAEMLLQSHEPAAEVRGANGADAPLLRLLPALPPDWPDGNVRGLLARGGIAVDLAWGHGRLQEVRLCSPRGATCGVVHGPYRVPVELAADAPVHLGPELKLQYTGSL